MEFFIIIALGVLIFWWLSNLDSPNNSSKTTTTNQGNRHQVSRYNQNNQPKEQEAKRRRELEDKRLVEQAEKERAFNEYLNRQDELATQALEKKLAAEWEAKQKQIAEQTERLRQATIAEQQKKEREREEQRRQAEIRAEQQRQVAARQQREAEERTELEFYENETDYYYALDGIYGRSPYSFSFATIRSLSRNAGVWNELNSGVAQLQSEDQLQQYTFSYGNMHRAKLLQAFESLVNNRELDLNGQAIEIIDYGCGQGIGTVVFFDFIKSHPEFNYSVRRVRLIEPSTLALKRAALHVRYSLSSVNEPQVVHAINKELDDITVNNLACDTDTVKFHIFSNILDVEYFDLYDLYDKIVDSTSGLNYFICVSPNIFSDGSHPRNQRLVRFRQYFQLAHNTTLISRRTCSIQSNSGNPWTRFEKVFKVDFDEVFNNTISRPVPSFYSDEDDNDLPF